MKNILWFREINMSNIAEVGGKGASLGEMENNNFPVPTGFVVTSGAYFSFLEETKIKDKIVSAIDAIDVENTVQLESVTAQIRQVIESAKMPLVIKNEIIQSYRMLNQSGFVEAITKNDDGTIKTEIVRTETPNPRPNRLMASEYALVAVRSSATAEDLPEASFAGQQETYLNIYGEEDVVKAVQRCWASLFTARAVYYRKKQGFATEKVGLCAVVQRMVQSDVSGIMFTADPTGDLNKIIIEGGFGLGETIVSGSVTPDNYVVDKANMTIANKRINKQEWMLIKEGKENVRVNLGRGKADVQKLSDDKIVELAQIGKRIEEHYQKPMDIEWAMEGNILFIVQARPITTLTKKVSGEEIQTSAKPIIEGLSAAPGIVTGIVKVVPEIEDIEKVTKGDILVTRMTSPSWVPVMKKASGIITNEGGRTCHAAIVSRELGIPCVVGTSTATETLTDGMEVTIDGFSGKVYSGRIEITHEVKKIDLLQDDEIDQIEAKLEGSIKESESKPNILKKIVTIEKEYGGIKYKEMTKEQQETEEKELIDLLKDLSIKVKVNVALPDAAESAAATKADGVGLLRAEHMITSSGMHPAEFIRQNKDIELKDTVKRGIRVVAEKFTGPVWFRTFDARSDEYKELVGGEKEPKEENPMIGWHGIRRDIDEPRMLKAQLLAIKELYSEGLTNVGVMLPFVVSLDEVIAAKAIAQEVGLPKEVDIGVMIETPAAVWIIDELIPHIKFVSFGTNDLTQLTLGMDRNNEHVQKNFSELHPSILRQLEYVIKKCKPAGVVTSICGQAASNPEMVKKLVWYGIDSVSANIDAVEEVRQTVIVEEKKKILEMYNKPKWPHNNKK
jgi:pyruvate,water dikinase